MDVDERMDLFINMVCPVSGIYVTKFDGEYYVKYTTAQDESILALLFMMGTDGDHQKQIDKAARLEQGGDQQRIYISINKWGLARISEYLINPDGSISTYVLGPVWLNKYTAQDIRQEMGQRRLSVQDRRTFMEEVKKLPVVSLTRFYEFGVMFHYCITGEHIQPSDFGSTLEEDDEQFLYERTRYKSIAYENEQKLMKLVEEGNLDFRKERSSIGMTEEWNAFGGGDIIRQVKNYIIINTTLSSRAAIRGGLSVEAAMTLSDRFIEQAEDADDVETLMQVNDSMLETYVRRVRAVKLGSGISPQIQKCCDYINTHFDEKADIHQLASYAGYTDYYFSRKFKEEVGAGVREYAAAQKIEAAKAMLTNSSKRVNEIAQELGFVNLSYFADVFRKNTGMSPTEYREKHAGGAQ